jgi:hypothetical protein
VREATRSEAVPMDPMSCVPRAEPLASPRQLSWLLVRDPADLKMSEQQMLAFMQQEPVVKMSYQLTQDFLGLMKKRHRFRERCQSRAAGEDLGQRAKNPPFPFSSPATARRTTGGQLNRSRET